MNVSAFFRSRKDFIFNFLLYCFSFFALALALLVVGTLLTKSLPAFKHSGFNLILSSTWDPISESFGGLSFIVGTLLSSILALCISAPISIAIAISVGVYIKNPKSILIIKSMLDILSGIPSVVYGFWGIMVLVPLIQKVEILLGVVPYGVGIITSSLVLSLMILPYSASLSSEVIKMVPNDLKEAAYSLGATSSEMIFKVIIPYSRTGFLVGFLMSFGRAISETMAVTMLIGNSSQLPKSLFDPGNTLASVIANEFSEASDPLYLAHLVALAAILLFLATFFSFVSRIIISKWTV